MSFECPPENSSESPESCGGLGIVTARNSTYEGQEVAGRRRGVAIAQGQSASVRLDFLGADGLPVDFSSCGSSNSSSSSSGEYCFQARFQEASRVGCQTVYSASGRLSGASTVTVEVPEAVAAEPAIYRMEVGAILGGKLKAADVLFLTVEPSLFGVTLNQGRALIPGRSEVRMALRDSSPADSYLNEAREWDDGEIAFALLTAVLWFNEQRPPIRRKYTTSSFPYQRKWLEGALAELYRMAAVSYRREAVQYQASGTALNDKAKAPDYEQVAQEREKEFKLWARTVKVQLNMDAGVGYV